MVKLSYEYNKVTLNPKNEEHQELFHKFRSKDIIEMYKFGAILITCTTVSAAVSAL